MAFEYPTSVGVCDWREPGSAGWSGSLAKGVGADLPDAT